MLASSVFLPHVILAISSTFCVGEGCLVGFGGVFWGFFLRKGLLYFSNWLSVEGEYAQ